MVWHFLSPCSDIDDMKKNANEHRLHPVETGREARKSTLLLMLPNKHSRTKHLCLRSTP